MNKVLVVGLILLVGMALAGCAAGPNVYADTPDEDGVVWGFWAGLWHGIIAPITFVISIFSDSVGVYAVHNSGGWYDFGFLFGLTSVWGGGGAASARRRRHRDY